jgi:SAM-dependent methyltransferase
MALEDALDETRAYFSRKLREHGNVPAGVDWNSDEAQVVRFQQLVRIIDPSTRFSIIDYGCGYGALAGYMQKLGWDFTYDGFDMLAPMVQAGKDAYPDMANVRFTVDDSSLPIADYVVAGGIFNLKFSAPAADWRQHSLQVLEKIDKLSTRAFSFNMLTSYSDIDRMEARPDAYFGDPLFYFDYCKRRFSRNVALLHDYVLYDFTILVRKDN